MARKKKGRHGGRVTPKGSRPRSWGGGSGGGSPSGGRRASRHLRSASLYDILIGVSQFAAAELPITSAMAVYDRAAWPQALADSLVDPNPPLELIAIAAELLGDDGQPIRAALAGRGHDSSHVGPLQEMLAGASISGAFEAREAFDEQRHVTIGVRLPGGEQLAAAMVIDHRAGFHLSDGFVAPESIDTIRQAVDREPELTVVNTPLPEIRAILDQALSSVYRTFPPVNNDTWPDHALLIEWMIGLLPEAPPEPEWQPMSEADQADFVEAFLASNERRALNYDDDAVAMAVESMLWFKDGYTNGDLYRWGPFQVEYFLGDWALRKLIMPEADMIVFPAVLAELIRWSHRRLGLATRHTEETLGVVDQMTPVFLDGLQPDRPKGVEALLAATRHSLGIDDGFDLSTDEWWARRQRELRHKAVGGAEVLAGLSTEQLPLDEEPDLARVDEEYRPLVHKIARLGAPLAKELYGEEFATVVNRLTVRLAELDPAALLRGKPETAAAAIVWMAAAANGDYRTPLVEIKEALGTKASPKDRARTFTKVMGGEFDEFEPLALGSPDFLTGFRRQELLNEHLDDIDDLESGAGS